MENSDDAFKALQNVYGLLVISMGDISEDEHKKRHDEMCEEHPNSNAGYLVPRWKLTDFFKVNEDGTIEYNEQHPKSYEKDLAELFFVTSQMVQKFYNFRDKSREDINVAILKYIGDILYNAEENSVWPAFELKYENSSKAKKIYDLIKEHYPEYGVKCPDFEPKSSNVNMYFRGYKRK